MKLGVLIYGGLDERIATAKSLGATGISLLPTEYKTESDLMDSLEKTTAEGIEFAQIPLWSYNPLMPTEGDIEMVKAGIAASAKLPTRPSLIFGAGGYAKNPFFPHPDNWKPEAMEKAASNIRPLANIAEEVDVKLALEPHYAVVARDEVAIRTLYDKIGSPAVGFNADIVNLIKIDDFWKTEVAIDRILDAVGDLFLCAHLKDLAVEEKLHLHLNECPAGEGNLNFRHLLKKLDQTLSSETYALVEHTPTDKLPETVGFVRRQASAEGVEFLT
jgi:sugar phosphate isomerase/epimerase